MMNITNGFHCSACKTYLSHPVDECPVCGDHFYWLVACNDPVPAGEIIRFLQEMISLSHEPITIEYLRHGDQLWLPPSFWHACPDGRLLSDFPWILDLVLFQHPKPEAAEPTYAASPALASAPSVSQDSMKGTLPKTTMGSREPSREPRRTKTDDSLDRKNTSPTKLGQDTQSASKGRQVVGSPKLVWPDLFVPSMIFLFFCFLSLSYLALRYHKNQMKPAIPSQVQSLALPTPKSKGDASTIESPNGSGVENDESVPEGDQENMVDSSEETENAGEVPE